MYGFWKSTEQVLNIPFSKIKANIKYIELYISQKLMSIFLIMYLVCATVLVQKVCSGPEEQEGHSFN